MDEKSRITDIYAREVLDSRGNPTVEVEVYSGDCLGSAIVPSGASTGVHEALELRDGGSRYSGKGVKRAVENVNTKIKEALLGKDVTKQKVIDEKMIELDGTENKSRLGANAVLGVSIAVARTASMQKATPFYEYMNTLFNKEYYKGEKRRDMSIPAPFANVINGGEHSGNNLPFQEFMITPVGAESFEESARLVSEVYHQLKKVLTEKYGVESTNVGDEGGFAPPMKSAEEALDVVMEAIEQKGLSKKVKLAVDSASSEFYVNEEYLGMSGEEFIDFWVELLTKYPLVSLEDPFDQDDVESFKSLMQRSIEAQVVGDDLLATNPERIKEASEKNLCDALLLKPNQVGTLSESFKAADLAFRNDWSVMVSHRSGETEDPFITDLSVALGCGQVKIGAPCRGERTAKYNQLLRIEDELERMRDYE